MNQSCRFCTVSMGTLFLKDVATYFEMIHIFGVLPSFHTGLSNSSRHFFIVSLPVILKHVATYFFRVSSIPFQAHIFSSSSTLR